MGAWHHQLWAVPLGDHYFFFFSRFWNPKHFTGIKICNFNVTMQTPALPHAHAQWGTRKLPKKIYAASTIDQLMATATNLSLSFLCSLREYHKYRTTTLHEVLSTVHERSNPYNQYAVTAEKVCQVLLSSWWLATFQKRCQGLHSWRRMTDEAEEYEPEARQDWAWW